MKLNETLLRIQYDEKEAAALRSSAADILIGMSGRKNINKGTLLNQMAQQEVRIRLRADQAERKALSGPEMTDSDSSKQPGGR